MACYSIRTVRANGAWEGTSNQLWQRTYKQTFRVKFDDRFSGPATIFRGIKDPRSGISLPQVGAIYSRGGTEFDNYAFAQSVNPKFECLWGTGTSWLVDVTYGPYDANEFPENPVDWPLIMWWGSHKYEKVQEKDVVTGKPILNSAFDKFADPKLIDDSRPILYVQRNEPVATFDPLLANNLYDHVNQADWVHGTGAKQFTFAQYCVKFSDRTMDKPVKNPIDATYYYVCVYAFELDKDGWIYKPLDQGYAVLDASTPPARKKLVGPDGQPLNEAALLDGSGHELATSATPVFLDYDVYPRADYTVFDMDLSKAIGR